MLKQNKKLTQELQKMFEQHRKEQEEAEKLLKLWNKLIEEGKA